MLDRQKLETVLDCRFPGARPQQIAAAANAIMGLEDEWEELAVTGKVSGLPRVDSYDLRDLMNGSQGGDGIRILRRRMK